MEKIAIGSKNPVKVKAVKNAVRRIWPNVDFYSIDVDSGISNQPRSNEEAIEGALNRARLSLEKIMADLGVGLEGCTFDTEYGMFVTGWVAVVDRYGRLGLGTSGGVLLPENIAVEIRDGKELGPVMDSFLGQYNIKHKQGTIGVLTNGLISRTKSFEIAVIYALARFINYDLYK